jgi:probable rRNA maturation factor
MKENGLEIKFQTKGSPTLLGLPFKEMKDKVLGKKYSLSLVFAKSTLMKKLNKEHRNKNKSTDILSFPLSKNSGEIFICLKEAKKMAPDFDRNFENFVSFLFIHGLMHLKGMTHGSKMDRAERTVRTHFKI